LKTENAAVALFGMRIKNNGKIKRKVLAEDKGRRYSSDMIILLMPYLSWKEKA
jgi:hypothetical protein